MEDLLNRSLNFLKQTLVDYKQKDEGPPVEIVNIATLGEDNQSIGSKNSIILSVINIEEDRLARDPNIYTSSNQGTKTIKRYNYPAQHFVASLLFTAYNKDQAMADYLDGLTKLEKVIRCFQERKVFQVPLDDPPPPENKTMLKIILEMESLKPSELNQLWSILGNKYMPSVLYKMRMISIQHTTGKTEVPIDKFKVQLWENNPDDLAGQLEESKFIKQ